jgi:hypothetical protein
MMSSSDFEEKLKRIKEIFISDTPQTGCRFLTVDTYQNAVDFYIRNKFDFLTTEDESDKTRLMYFDLNNILIS